MFCFLDDVIIVSKSLQDIFHTQSLVLSRFQAAGLKIKLNKCSFFQQQVKFLGHKVDRDGIHTYNDKVNVVKNFPVRINIDQIMQSIGFVGFYRQFIKKNQSYSSAFHSFAEEK